MELTQDAFLGGQLTIKQPKSGYRAAMDPVLLAAAVPALVRGKLLELGAGVGTASLCYAARVPNVEVLGLELQNNYAALANQNANLNNLEDRVKIISGDLLHPPPDLFPVHGFDQVMANPPYLTAAQAGRSPVEARNVANVEGDAGLKDWVNFALKMLKPKGGLTFIHRADRVDEMISLLYGKAGDITIIPLWPFAGQSAKRVVVRARKSIRGPARLTAGLVLHADKERYTIEAARVLRDGGALRID